VGCGKGSAMRTMLKYTFSKVDGIELSSIIANIAIQNFKRLKVNRCSVFTGDAGQFKIYNDYNYVYFFNPFPAVVMKEVIENLKKSAQLVDREIIIIYMSPTCTDVIEKSGVFELRGIYKRTGAWVTVYSNRSLKNSTLSSNKKMIPCTESSDIKKELQLYLQNFIQPDYIDRIK